MESEKELDLALKKENKNKKIKVLCITCGSEFDPKAEENKNLPTINFCRSCYFKNNN